MSEKIDFETNSIHYLELLGYLVIRKLVPQPQAEVRALTRDMYLNSGRRKNKYANPTV